MFEAEEAFVVPGNAWSSESTKHAVSAITYSPDGSLIALSKNPGKTEIITSYEGELRRTFEHEFSTQPVVGISFHPNEPKTLIFSTKYGYISIYDILKSEQLQMVRHLGSCLIDLSIDAFGDNFAVACGDGSIRVFDFVELKRKTVLVRYAHKNKVDSSSSIQTMLYNPDNSNIILSAVQNDKILIWDVRTCSVEKTVDGPHIKGHSIDVYDGKIITGSFREKHQIEIWDFASAKKIRDVKINKNMAGIDILVNTLNCSRNGTHLVAGGLGANVVQAFNFDTGACIGQ